MRFYAGSALHSPSHPYILHNTARACAYCTRDARAPRAAADLQCSVRRWLTQTASRGLSGTAIVEAPRPVNQAEVTRGEAQPAATYPSRREFDPGLAVTTREARRESKLQARECCSVYQLTCSTVSSHS